MKKYQRGFLHNLVLSALVLMGVVLMGWGYMQNQNQAGVAIARSVDTTRAQMDQVQKVLGWCRVMYPAGDNGTGFHKNLPGSPLDSSWVALRNVVCPGDTASGSIWLAAREQLGVPGQFLNEWEYRNVAAGVYLRTSVQSAGDPLALAVLAQVAARLPASQKNLTGDTLEILFSN